jgi:hypothetical protein
MYYNYCLNITSALRTAETYDSKHYLQNIAIVVDYGVRVANISILGRMKCSN